MDALIPVPHVTGTWPIDFWLMIVGLAMTRASQPVGWVALFVAIAMPIGAVVGANAACWLIVDTMTGGALARRDAARGAARHARRGR